MKKAPTYLMSIITMVFGCAYLIVSEPMPYHQRFMAVPLKDIPDTVLTLFMYTLRIVGSFFFSIAVTGIILVHHHSKETAWIRWTIFIMYSMIFIPLLVITLKVGLYTPWWVVGLLFVVNVINFFILFRAEKK